MGHPAPRLTRQLPADRQKLKCAARICALGTVGPLGRRWEAHAERGMAGHGMMAAAALVHLRAVICMAQARLGAQAAHSLLLAANALSRASWP